MQQYVVMTQTNRKCPFCDNAIALLEELGLPYEHRKLASGVLRPFLRAARRNTVPLIYKPGAVALGGYQELLDHLTEEGYIP